MPLPALLGALGRVAGSAGSAAAPPSGILGLVKSMQPLADGVGQVQEAFGKLTGTAGKLAGAVGLVNEPMTVAIGVLGKLRDSVASLGNSVSQFTKFTNPALTQRFTFALEDLNAVIGKALLPVLQFATRFVRMFADVINQVAGPFQRLLSAFFKPVGELLPTITNTIGPVVRMFGQFIDLFASFAKPVMVLGAAFLKIVSLPLEAVLSATAVALEVLLLPFSLLGKILSEIATAIGEFVTKGVAAIRKLLGLPTAAGSSTGAAFRSVSMGSVEDFQRRAMTLALGQGTGSADERSATLLDSIWNWLKNDMPQELWKLIEKLPAMIADQISKIPEKVADRATAFANDARNILSASRGIGADIGPPGGEAAAEAGRRLEERIRAWRAGAAGGGGEG